MSKLAHQRAYEQYPQGNDGSSARIGYTLGYDQAFKDFMEKACKYLAPINYTHPHLIDLDDFKTVEL